MRSAQKPFVVPVFLPHSGCPHRCVFCNQTQITGTSEDLADPMASDALRRHITHFLAYKTTDRGKAQIAFYGGNFLGLTPSAILYLLKTAQAFIDSGHIHSIRFSTRPDTIGTETLDMIRNYSVSTIELGVQSMDDKVLSLSKRGHTAADSAQALELLKTAGYVTGVQIMPHLPGDDGSQSLKTAEALVAFRPDMARLYPTVVLSGSPLARHYRQGRYQAATLADAITLAKKIYLIFAKNSIPVIRMGLQASESLAEARTILAGPYHPAFGHLVRSALYRDMAMQALQQGPSVGNPLTLRLHPAVESVMRGMKNTNLERLKKEFRLEAIRIITDDTIPTDSLICAGRSVSIQNLS
ncbi:MAG: radical SAM protein [Thermodesulfobacteriota bacterium]|nr:radical SAM protein [Thermodesulfobacteriota bacterium]